MESSVAPPESAELDLLLRRDDAADWRRWRYAAVGSALFHLFAITALLSYKGSAYSSLPPEQVLVRHLTPLVTPPDLTQRAPNKAPISKEIVAESIAPRPILKSPAPAPAAHAAPAPPPPAQLPPPVARVEPKPIIIEPPKIEAPAPQQTAQADTGKLTLQDVAPRDRNPGTGKTVGAIAIPNPSIQEAVRSLTRGGQQLGQSVGDLGADEGGAGPGLNLPPSAGRPRSSLELKSDPMGVDFRPYMLQVIAAIRRNWFAVYPEAARLGQRGQVSLQFAIAKQGLVAKVIFSSQSGAKALDQSAVAAISASNPLPPLPPEFKGDRIVLQMTFLYNMPR